MVRRLIIAVSIFLIAGGYGYFTDYLLLGSSLGIILGGYLALLDWHLKQYSFRTLMGGSLGVASGLFLSLIVLRSFIETPLDPTGNPIKGIFIVSTLTVSLYLGLSVGLVISRKWPGIKTEKVTVSSAKVKEKNSERDSYKILDTSVIIDGRIAEIIDIGFLEGELIVPRFILNELQTMADAGDNLKRNRGRRGLNILNRIRDELPIPVEIVDTEFDEISEVDAKLVELAKEMDSPILTNDFNLNKVARFQDVPVLNINDLSNAIKPVYIPGESFKIEVMKEGEEDNQGVGYLDDGTMVVIENAIDRIGETIPVTVTSVIQTSAGRMIFAREGEHEEIA